MEINQCPKCGEIDKKKNHYCEFIDSHTITIAHNCEECDHEWIETYEIFTITKENV